MDVRGAGGGAEVLAASVSAMTIPGGPGEQAAIVTGISRGLGAALAAELLERGFTVVGVGRASNPRLTGQRYGFVCFDLADSAGVDTALVPALEGLKERRPASVCLLNNAATAGPVGTLGRLTASEITSSLTVNLAAAVALANLFCRVFADADMTRRVINVSSGAAQTALPGEAVYCVAKAGLEMLTRALAAEHQAPSFRAITVRPGVMDTDMQAQARSQPPDILPSVELFKGFHRDGRLVAPAVVASKIVNRLVIGDVEHGRTYSYQEL
jgi:NAD(P)-dependent dehydrogenase (short-subunit alcohol dehydrogenase family)